MPCKNCQRQRRTCWYPVSQRGKRARSQSHQHDREDRAAVGFTGPTKTSHTPMLDVTFPLTPSQTSPGTTDGHGRDFTSNLGYHTQSSARGGGGSDSASLGIHTSTPESRSHSMPTSSTNPLSPIQIQNPHLPLPYSRPVSNDKDGGLDGAGDEEDVIPLQKVNWEHHGPWSWVSVCSRPGVRWVCEQTKSDEFVDIANGLTKTWSRRLKMRRFQPLRTKNPEPDPDLAWKYVTGELRACFYSFRSASPTYMTIRSTL